ncbi:hypothetical protein [Urechidicola sp. KH5]
MKRFTFFLPLLFGITIFAQSTEIDTLGIDIFSATYTLENNILYKTTDQETYNYQNLALGNVTSVDFVNTLEIVVFYADFNAVVILDNRLNQIHELRFIPTILFVNKGIVNTIWRYNETAQVLELYDYKLKKVISSSPVIANFVPIEMKSNFNSVTLIGENKSLIFDQYLALLETKYHQKNN